MCHAARRWSAHNTRTQLRASKMGYQACLGRRVTPMHHAQHASRAVSQLTHCTRMQHHDHSATGNGAASLRTLNNGVLLHAVLRHGGWLVVGHGRAVVGGAASPTGSRTRRTCRLTHLSRLPAHDCCHALLMLAGREREVCQAAPTAHRRGRWRQELGRASSHAGPPAMPGFTQTCPPHRRWAATRSGRVRIFTQAWVPAVLCSSSWAPLVLVTDLPRHLSRPRPCLVTSSRVTNMFSAAIVRQTFGVASAKATKVGRGPGGLPRASLA